MSRPYRQGCVYETCRYKGKSWNDNQSFVLYPYRRNTPRWICTQVVLYLSKYVPQKSFFFYVAQYVKSSSPAVCVGVDLLSWRTFPKFPFMDQDPPLRRSGLCGDPGLVVCSDDERRRAGGIGTGFLMWGAALTCYLILLPIMHPILCDRICSRFKFLEPQRLLQLAAIHALFLVEKKHSWT